MRHLARLCLCLCLPGLARAAQPATLEELTALAGQQAFPELLERAEGVPPAARTEAWRELVARAATAVVGGSATTPEPFARAAKADAWTERFAFLSARAPFVAARDQVVISALQACLETGEEACLKAFQRYEQTLSPAASLAAGKLLRGKGYFAARWIELFARGVGAKDAPACKAGDLAEVVGAALDLPEGTSGAQAGRRIAFDWCWTALQPSLKAGMVHASSYRLKNTCKELRARRALSALQDELCKDEGL